MKTKKQSFLLKIFTVVFVLNAFFSPFNTPRAHALFGAGDIVIDPTNLFQNITTAISTAVSSATGIADLSWNTVGKNLLDFAVYSASQKLLNQLTNNTITWIQGGFHGSPSFAVDTKAIGAEIADDIAGEIVHDIKNVGVCNFTASYKDDLVNKVTIDTKAHEYKYRQQAKCPFQENLAFKASDFYSGATKFTWKNFGNALEDNGNPYGIEMITAQEKSKREESAKKEKEKKLSWSNGYVDIKDTTDCDYPSSLFSIPNDPGDPSTQYDPALPLVTAADAATQNNAVWADPATVKVLQDKYCKTTTPGKIVEDQLTQALGEDMRRIGFADNMNKIIAAFLDQITQQTIRGVFGKGGTGGRSSVGGVVGQGGGTTIGTSNLVNTVVVTTRSGCTPQIFTPLADGCVTTTADTATILGTVTGAISTANVAVWFTWSDTLSKTSFTATISGTTLTVSSISLGKIAIGQSITGPGIPGVTPITITGQTSGLAGSIGTYTISAPLTITIPTVITSQSTPSNTTWTDLKNPTLTAPSPAIATQGTEQVFRVTLTGLNPGTTYYYNANASTVQSTPEANLHGTVYTFKTK